MIRLKRHWIGLLIAITLSSVATQAAAAGGWVARHGMTSNTYQQAFDSYVGQGYRLVDLSAYSHKGEPRFAAVWWKQNPASPIKWAAHHDLSSAQFQQSFNHYVAKGFRLVDVSGYAHKGKARYAAIWQKRGGSSKWIARHGMSPAKYRQTLDKMAVRGYRPTNVSGFTIAGQVRFAAIWTKDDATSWRARHDLTSAQYQKAFNRLAAGGFRLVDVSVYRAKGQPRYAAIWIKSSGMTWQARHGLTSAQYQSSFSALASKGYKLVRVAGTGLPGGPRYASIWWKL